MISYLKDFITDIKINKLDIVKIIIPVIVVISCVFVCFKIHDVKINKEIQASVSKIQKLEQENSAYKTKVIEISTQLDKSIQDTKTKEVKYHEDKTSVIEEAKQVISNHPEDIEIPKLSDDYIKALNDCEDAYSSLQKSFNLAIEKSEAEEKVIDNQDNQIKEYKIENTNINKSLQDETKRKKLYRLGFGGTLLVILVHFL
jgi:hypothetical protein